VVAAGLGLFALVGPKAALAITESPQTSLSDGLVRCARIDAPDERLACYDALATRSPPSAPETVDAPAQRPVTPTTGPVAAKPPIAPEPETAEGPPERRKQWLSILPYRRNYILPVTYNANPNRNFPAESIELPFLGDALDNVEMKFQLSFQVPVWRDILNQDLDLYFAYTQLSFFQAYNREYSSPFRDTNYEPEIGLDWHPKLSLGGWQLASARIALNHQSNGRSEPLSRSWNRLIGQAQVEYDDLALALRLWHRFREDAGSDDNPDITDFLGNGELYAGYDLGKHHLGLMVRNPLERAAVQLDWSYPLTETVRLYVQYFNGYGESLLDYDHSVNRIGAGFLLNEWP
jgi:phospholipase A1